MTHDVDTTALHTRIVGRDDLLRLAVETGKAEGIVEAEDGRSSAIGDEGATADLLLAAAVDAHWSIRGLAYQSAASILLLRDRIHALTAGNGDVDSDDLVTASDLLNSACDEFSGPGPTVRHPTQEVDAEVTRIMALRQAGQVQQAMDRANRPPEEFAGTGVEYYRGLFEYEFTAACLGGNASRLARGLLSESDGFWSGHERAQHWSFARGRRELAIGLLDIADGQLPAALGHLSHVQNHLAGTHGDRVELLVAQLSAALSVAECAAAVNRADRDEEIVLRACSETFALVERVIGRWGVVARSRHLLGAVLRVVLGDLAAVVATLSGTAAGQLGLRVSMAAKQSGYAELIRSENTILNEEIGLILDELRNLEDDDDPDQLLETKRGELSYEVSPLLADLVLPGAVDIEPVIEVSSRRVIVDFVRLMGSDGAAAWFRTTLVGPDDVVFERIAVGPGLHKLLEDAGWRGGLALVDQLHSRRAGTDDAWSTAACELLPDAVRHRVAEATRENPIELLISPHMQLCRIPWNALKVGEHRLVERACIAQIPMLSTLTVDRPKPVAGPALVWLADELEIAAGQRAWQLPPEVRVASCAVPVVSSPVERSGSLRVNLESQEWSLVHVASHGSADGPSARRAGRAATDKERHVGPGVGLKQGIAELTAADAFGVPWPPNVVLAACHVGAITDTGEDELLGFVVAAMAGGARCVVGGLHLVSQVGTDEIVGRLIALLDGHTTLERALREAQLSYLDDGVSANELFEWALLAAFVR